MDPLTDPYAGAPYNPTFANDRTRYAAELEDPDLLQQFNDLVHNEVGSQGPAAQQAFTETLFNRASARGKSLAETINDRNYYPAVSFRRGTGANYYLNLAAAMHGSDVSAGATGNASGSVGFAGGPQTFAAGGERFGIEGPDLNRTQRDPLTDPYAGAPITSKAETPPAPAAPVLDSTGKPYQNIDLTKPAPELAAATAPQAKSTIDQITDFLKKPSPAWLQKVEGAPKVAAEEIGKFLSTTQPLSNVQELRQGRVTTEEAPPVAEQFSNAYRAAVDVAKGFIPTTAKATAEFATPAASTSDEFSNLYHAATDLINGKPLQDVVEQYYPESQQFKKAKEAGPGSYEAWKTGLDTVVSLLMAKQIGHGLKAPPDFFGREPIKPTLTPAEQDALTQQDADLTASLVKGTPETARVAPGSEPVLPSVEEHNAVLNNDLLPKIRQAQGKVDMLRELGVDDQRLTDAETELRAAENEMLNRGGDYSELAAYGTAVAKIKSGTHTWENGYGLRKVEKGTPAAETPPTPPPGALTTTVLSPEDLMTVEEKQARRAGAEQKIQQERTQTRIDEMAQQIYDQAKAADEGGAGSPDLRVEEAIAKQRQAAHTVSQDPEVLAAFEQAHKMASEAVDTSQFAAAEHVKGLQAEGAQLGLEADMARRQGLRVPPTVEQRIAQINEQLKTGLPQERPSRYVPPSAEAPAPEAQPAPPEIPAQAEPQKAPTGQAAPAVKGDEPIINQPSQMNKRQIDNLIPFNIQGNKTKLIASHIGRLVEKAARGARRVIDAFAGSGTYTHYVRARGLGKQGDILNEFDPLRHITHKQIRDNPEGVARAVQSHVDELRKLINVKPGDPFDAAAEANRTKVGEWFRRKFASYIKPGQDLVALTKSRAPVEMQDSPELAGLYTVAQNQAFSYIPMNAELSPKPKAFGTLRQPGFGVVIKATGNKVGLFKNEQAATVNAGPIIKAAGERFQGLDVRRGDGWKLIKDEAGEGDFVPVDTSYLNKGNEVTTNYNAATREDATPSVWLRKVTENLLPAWDRGAKLLITNNYDPVVARQLRELGFEVHTAERSSSRGAGVVAETSKEIVATNFDHNTGEVYPRRDAVLREAAKGANRPDELGGGAAGGAGRPEVVAPRVEVKNEPVSGRASGVTDAGKVTSPAGTAEREVRPPVGEETPLRQPGQTPPVREQGAVQQTVAQAPPETVKDDLAGNTYGRGAAGLPVEPPGREHPQQGPVPPSVEGQQPPESPAGGRPDQPGAVLPPTEAEAPKIAPHHEALKGLYGEEAIKRGRVLEPEVLAQNGREDVASGRIDPYEVASKVKEGGAVTPRELGAISAEHENLARQAIAAEKAAREAPTPENRAAYAEARDKAEDFAVNVLKPAGTMWGEMGRALQETAAIDYATETGLRNAAIIRLDRELTASEAAKIKREAARVQKVVKKADASTEKLSATIEKKTKGTDTPTEAEMRDTLAKVLKDLTPCS